VSSAQETAAVSDADEVERHPCPRCAVKPGSPCRTRSGAVAGTYHTARFTKVPRLAKELRVPTPSDRGPGQPWRPGTPPPAPIPADTPSADIHIGYARCSLWGSRIPIRVLTCWFLGGIAEVSGRLDAHGVVPVVRPDAEHSRCDLAADPR
jgi:hypothetical protein